MTTSIRRSPGPRRPVVPPGAGRLLSLLAAAALAAAACTGGTGAAPSAAVPSVAPTATAAPASGAPSAPAPSAAPGSEASPIRSGPPTVIPGGEGSGVPQTAIDAAIADAAGRAGVDASAVTLVSAETRQWPSGALGCPQMGFMYTDMITPGYRIVVEAGGTPYDYRATVAGGGSDLRYCERPQPGG